jgi:hypothetical protein
MTDPGCLLSDPVRERAAARFQTVAGTIHIVIDTNPLSEVEADGGGPNKENDAIGAEGVDERSVDVERRPFVIGRHLVPWLNQVRGNDNTSHLPATNDLST